MAQPDTTYNSLYLTHVRRLVKILGRVCDSGLNWDMLVPISASRPLVPMPDISTYNYVHKGAPVYPLFNFAFWTVLNACIVNMPQSQSCSEFHLEIFWNFIPTLKSSKLICGCVSRSFKPSGAWAVESMPGSKWVCRRQERIVNTPAYDRDNPPQPIESLDHDNQIQWT